MSTKAFISLVVGVLVLGAVIAGSFLGGLAIGKNQEAEAAAAIAPVPQAPTLATQPSEETAGQNLAQLREQLQSGELTQEDLAQLRRQFLDAGSGGFGGGRPRGGSVGFGGRRGLTGTIESVEGATVTLNTSGGHAPGSHYRRDDHPEDGPSHSRGSSRGRTPDRRRRPWGRWRRGGDLLVHPTRGAGWRLRRLRRRGVVPAAVTAASAPPRQRRQYAQLFDASLSKIPSPSGRPPPRSKGLGWWRVGHNGP